MDADTEKLVREVLEELRDFIHTLHLLAEDVRVLAHHEIKTSVPARDRR